MPQEIERRFIFRQLPELLELHRPDHVHQAYTLIDSAAEREERVRYRRMANGLVSYEHFYKLGQGRSREEVSTPISPVEFRLAFASCLGDPVIKDIYHEQWGGRWLELHVFRSHRPFMTVEIEFGHEDAAKQFMPFDWFDREVTDDQRYNTASVALNGVPSDFHLNEELIQRFFPGPALIESSAHL